MGGYKITFDGPVSNTKSDLTTYMIHWNSIISTTGAKYLVINFKNFYINNPMLKHKYYNIALKLIPQEVINTYNLMDKQINGFLRVKVEKGMYGIVQAGIITHTALKEHLCPFGYKPVQITPGL